MPYRLLSFSLSLSFFYYLSLLLLRSYTLILLLERDRRRRDIEEGKERQGKEEEEEAMSSAWFVFVRRWAWLRYSSLLSFLVFILFLSLLRLLRRQAPAVVPQKYYHHRSLVFYIPSTFMVSFSLSSNKAKVRDREGGTVEGI